MGYNTTRAGVLINYIEESKRLTKDERHLYKFKKKYHYEPTNKNEGQITVDGQKHNINLDFEKHKKPETVIDKDQPGEIRLNKNIFKLKPKYTDAILQHEIGHAKMHYRNPKSISADKKFAHTKYMYHTAIQDHVLNNKPLNDKEIQKTINATFDPEYGEDISHVDSDFRNKRNKMYTHMLKYTNYSSGSNPMEYEADRFSANRTTKSNVKRAIRKMNKMNRGSKLQNKLLQDNYERRSKALDDPKISSSDIYK